MKWVFSLLTSFNHWMQDGSPPNPAGEAPEAAPPPDSQPARDIGILVTFTPQSNLRGMQANLIYTALLELGEIVWFYPNFVIASEAELHEFRLTLRTTALWEQIQSQITGPAGGNDVWAVWEVPPQYEDPTPATVEAAPVPRAERSETAASADLQSVAEQKSIRVDLERLDALSNLVGELAVEKAQLIELTTHLETACTEETSRTLVQSLRRSVAKLSGVSTQLQEQATELRMVPVGTLFRRFTRLVRDLQGNTGKRLVLQREGEDTLLDKAIAEEMADPLLHLIRNAADHGIETEAERRQAAKARVGTITLRAYDQGDEIIIEVEDDGRGIDSGRVRAKAVERGLISAEVAAGLSEQEALQLIFLPGFSTAATITDISGRGVGMDVVRVNVERLRGTISLNTKVGHGTRLTIRLPLTVSILQVMLADVGNSTIAVPMTSLRGVVRLTDENRMLLGSVLRHQERLVPLVDLNREWWNIRGTGSSALLLSTGLQEAGLVVDSLRGLGEIVVRPLGEFVGRLPGVAGAAILADGRVSLILDPVTLVPDSEQQGGMVHESANTH